MPFVYQGRFSDRPDPFDLVSSLPEPKIAVFPVVGQLFCHFFSLFEGKGVKKGYNPMGVCRIGKDSEEDILGANSAGLISVLIDRAGLGSRWGQSHTVKSLDEIRGMI